MLHCSWVSVEAELWPSFMEMVLHLEAFCPSALPPGISESSRATVSDDQTSCRERTREGMVCPWKEQWTQPGGENTGSAAANPAGEAQGTREKTA